MAEINHASTHDHANVLSTIRPYYRLLILACIVLAGSVLGALQSATFWDTWMRLFMGLYLVSFGLLQTVSLQKTAAMLRQYDPLAQKIAPYGYVLPLLLLLLGMLFLADKAMLVAAVVALLVAGITLTGVVKTMTAKKTVRCACLGTVIDVHVGWVTFVENAIMVGMALLMIIAARF